ncbi:MAG: hypothetical protein AB7G62_17940 [Magnetospirillum sp.]
MPKTAPLVLLSSGVRTLKPAVMRAVVAKAQAARCGYADCGNVVAGGIEAFWMLYRRFSLDGQPETDVLAVMLPHEY